MAGAELLGCIGALKVPAPYGRWERGAQPHVLALLDGLTSHSTALDGDKALVGKV